MPVGWGHCRKTKIKFAILKWILAHPAMYVLVDGIKKQR